MYCLAIVLYLYIYYIDGESGCDIRRMTHVPENEVRRVIDILSAEGVVYSTLDEDHFAFAE